jgi:hypothetical protein
MDLAKGKIEDTSDAFSVSVAVRIRPLNGTEKIESPQICVTPIPEQNIVVVGKDRQFVFDKVFGMESRQAEVFQGCVHELVKSCFAGYNATVLAYGQTGSGKTFTMGSGQRLNILKEDLGIIPRVIDMIFEEIEARRGKSEFLLKVSFLEIYNEEIHDLLDPNRMVPDKQITIREDKGSIYLMGLHEEKVTSYEEMASCLDKGGLHRSTASTLMNAHSSRSHAIFTINIEQHILEDQVTGEKVEDETQEYMTAKFHFVDLAGSERAKRTGASGATLKEGISINKGLLCLGNVISALTEDSKKNAHVPYRDSKLTRILQDSLGGNSRTFMIACVSPALINFDETLNALKYASRARHIKNKPIVNRDPNSAMIAQLKQEVYQLKQEIKNYERLLNINPADLKENLQLLKQSDIESEEELKRNKLRVQQMDRKLDQVHAEIENYKLELQSASIEKMEIMKDRDMLKIQLENALQLLQEHGIVCEMPQQTSLIDDYNNRIDKLTSDIKQQKFLYDELRQDYDKLLKTSERDNELLTQKNQELEKLRRMVNTRGGDPVNSDVIQERIKRSMTDFGRRFAENVLASIEKPHSPERTQTEMDEIQEVFDEELPSEELKEQEQKLKVNEEQLTTVESNIKEKEELLKNIEYTFKEMQSKLVDEMSQQYYKKIEELETELRQTERERDLAIDRVTKSSSSTTEKQTVAERYKQKIQMLEDKLKENRRKERDQNSLHKLVEAQKQQIGRLAEEIRRAKQQKVALSRKIREEAEAYQKWKTTRQKEMIQMKRQSLQKDREIQKLLSENRKKDILAKRKTEELAALQKRQRDIAMRRKRDMKTEQETLQTWVNQYTTACVTEKETAEKLETEMKEKQSLEEEIERLQDSYARIALEVEKLDMQLNGQDLPGNEEQLAAKIATGKQEMGELNEQLEVLEEKLKFKLALIEEYNLELANSQMEDIKSKSLTINSITEAQILITALFDEIMNKATKSKKLEKTVIEKQVNLDSLQQEVETHILEKSYLIQQKNLEISKLKKEFEDRKKELVEELEEAKNRHRVIVPVEPEDNCGDKRVEEMEAREKEYQDIIEQYKKKLDLVTNKYRKLRKQCDDIKDSSMVQDEEAKKKPQSQAFTSLSRAREAAKKVKYMLEKSSAGYRRRDQAA